MPHRRQTFFGLSDAMPKTFIDNQFCFNTHILQALIEFVGIGNGDTFIQFTGGVGMSIIVFQI